jgi:endonuclease/exonuclease/phosphatase (EEP) superfamily protein YafD
MFLLRRLPAFLACLLLGALCLRLGLSFLLDLPITLLLVGILFIRKAWAQITLTTLLAMGALGWLAMTGLRVQQRLALGEPWLRLAAILLAVACFTAWAAWLIRPGAPLPTKEKN